MGDQQHRASSTRAVGPLASGVGSDPMGPRYLGVFRTPKKSTRRNREATGLHRLRQGAGRLAERERKRVSRLQGQQPTESRDASRPRQPRWLQLGWIIIGLALDWRCGFEWFGGKSSFYSGLVLCKTGLIMLACAGVALLAVRLTRAAKWRDALPLFCLLSGFAYIFLSVGWDAHRR